MSQRLAHSVAIALVFWLSVRVSAQQATAHPPEIPGLETPSAAPTDPRSQYPSFLANSYFGVSAGYIAYPFSSRQLEPGYRADRVLIPHAAASVVLFGHRFNDYVSADVTYMRPIKYVLYEGINHDGATHSVWMAFGEFMVKSQVPIGRRVAIYGTARLGLTNRTGFSISGSRVVQDATFRSLMFGSGAAYHPSSVWDILAGFTYSPPSLPNNQPHMLFVEAGARYTMRPLSEDHIRATTEAGFVFPQNLIQLGYATNAFGFGVNDFVSKTVPVFWTGNVSIASGVALRYERNVFHTRRVFGLDLGTSVAHWQDGGNAGQFFTLSAYPLLRFTFLRAPIADVYGFYSLAGPSFISVTAVDGRDIGTHRFTFQDSIGVGSFLGAGKRFMAGLSVAHYSNGNLFPKNPGVTIPLMLSIGYTF
jgi:hypothetical protein